MSNTSGKKLKVILAILPVVIFLGLLAYSFKSRETMAWLYAMTSYYFIFALCLIWLFVLSRYLSILQFSAAGFLKTYWPGLVLALAMTALIFASVPVQFKILGDETNLLSVSQDMYYHKRAYLISMARLYNGSLQVLDVSIPNRPLLFPFAINIFHTLFGYRPENVFMFNFSLLFILLAGVYVVIRKAMDAQSAAAGIFLILAYPIVSISATSGGYDLFSTVFFALALTVFYQFLKSPQPISFAFLWVTLLMFSNIRYESCIFFLILVAAAARFIKPGYFREAPYVYSLTPLVSLPFIWQRFLSQGTYENPSHIPLFAVSSFIKHGKIFIQNFLNLDLYLPYAGLLNVTAVVVIGYGLKLLLTKSVRLAHYQKYFTVIFLFCIGTMMVIVLSHHFGRYDRPTQARLFIYFSIFCALTPLFLKAVHTGWITSRKFLVISCVIFIFYHPVAANHAFINSMIITRIHQHAQNYFKHLNDPDALIVTAYATHYSALNYSAVTIDYANTHARELLSELKAKRYSRILVLQEIDYATQLPKWPNQLLLAEFKLTPLKQIQVAGDRYLRISRLDL